MKLSLFGTGYVGLVTGACLADVGHEVVCLDIDAGKIERMQRGELPVYETGLDDIVERTVRMGSLSFTTDTAQAVRHGEVLFIAVGTPPDETGAADLRHVLAAAEEIGRLMEAPRLIVVKSTVPVGTAEKVRETIARVLSSRRSGLGFDVVSNPEFLKEGAAVSDFLKPDRIVVGASSSQACEVMKQLYEPFNRSQDRMLYMDPRSAELTKYAANAMLATKVSFINEMANLAERLGADIEQVRKGIGADSRIGHQFIYPGIGYGGSCFPKDVQALKHTAEDLGYEAPLIEAVHEVNERQKQRLFTQIASHFGGAENLRGRTFALWGLAFKPGTNDMREAPSRVLIEALWAVGARIRTFDPVAMSEARRIYGEREDLVLCDSKYGALDGADALVLCTEWAQFRAPDFAEMGERLRFRLIFDGRNVFTPQRLVEDGWTYFSVGRRAVYAEPQIIRHMAGKA